MKKSSFFLFLQYSGISLFFMLIAYPLLHEVGHILGAIFMGGKVVAASYFPIPSVTCSFNSLSQLQSAIIAFSGILLPIFIFITLPVGKRKRPILNFGALLYEIVIVFSLMFSIINCIFTLDNEDDILKITNHSPSLGLITLLIITSITITVLFIGIKKKTHLALKQLSEQ